MEQPGGRRNLPGETQVSSSNTSLLPERRAVCQQVLCKATSQPEHTAPQALPAHGQWLSPGLFPGFREKVLCVWSRLPSVHLHHPADQELTRPLLSLTLRAAEGHSSRHGAFHQYRPCCLPHCPLSGEKMRQLTAKAFHYCQITTSRVAGSREETAAAESARKAMLTAHGS